MNIGNIDMNGGYLGGEEVIKCYQGNTVVWEQSSGSPIDYSTIPLTFKITNAGNIYWKKSRNATAATIQYKKNDGEWTSITSTTGDGVTISVVAGDIVEFKGNNNRYGTSDANWNALRLCTCGFEVYGNIMSLFYGDNFSGQTSITQNHAIAYFFSDCTGLTSAENLILPATSIPASAYQLMFIGCTSLTKAPNIPVTAVTGQYAMQQMFRGCASLTTAPDLLTETLQVGQYAGMFSGCTNLNYIKCIASNASSVNCTSDWTPGVASNGTFVKKTGTTWSSGKSGIPSGWTVVNDGEIDYSTIPLTFEITGDGNIRWKSANATYTKTIEYSKNGDSWTSITSSTAGVTIPVVSGDTVQFRGDNTALGENGGSSFSGTTCQFNVKGNIISLLNSTGYTDITTLVNAYALNNLFINCTGLTSAEHLVLQVLTFNERAAYASMFEGCTSLTTAPSILPATTLGRSCYWKMFYGCTSLTQAPELPATTLTTYAYLNMFDGCTNLNYVKCLAETGNSTSNCENWLRNVSSTGTFVTPSTTTWGSGVSGIPNGWTRVNSD